MSRLRDEIDSELRLLAAVRRPVVEDGGPMPDISVIDERLDGRQLCGQGDAGGEDSRDAGVNNGGA